MEGGGQDIKRLEVVTSDNRKKTPVPLADLQIQNMSWPLVRMSKTHQRIYQSDLSLNLVSAQNEKHM